MTAAGDPLEAVEIGATTTVAKTVSESDVYLFAGITGDFSPNHVDEAYMEGGRYGRRIAHGALLVGFMSAATAKMQLGRTASLGYDRVRFVAPVFFGDTITAEYRVSAVDRDRRRVYADLTCRNQRGEVVATATHIRAFVD
jgi:3-hydroxybutyryl-CoA dehydratase